jgi:hypothetical protein
MSTFRSLKWAAESPQWCCLLTLFHAGRRGVPAEDCGYPRAGRWEVLLELARHDPPLVREVFRKAAHAPNHWVVITDAGRELVAEYLQRLEVRST